MRGAERASERKRERARERERAFWQHICQSWAYNVNCSMNAFKIVDHLIQHNADLELPGAKDGSTPLGWCAFKDSYDVGISRFVRNIQTCHMRHVFGVHVCYLSLILGSHVSALFSSFSCALAACNCADRVHKRKQHISFLLLGRERGQWLFVLLHCAR